MQAWPATNMVLMPYGPNLYHFGLWYRQLWAESLGKDGLGSTPILAPGPVDQHSQLQLFLDGPGGNLFTILQAPETAPRRVDAALADAIGAGYLGWAPLGRFDRGPGAGHGHDVDRRRAGRCAASASRRPMPAPSVP